MFLFHTNRVQTRMEEKVQYQEKVGVYLTYMYRNYTCRLRKFAFNLNEINVIFTCRRCFQCVESSLRKAQDRHKRFRLSQSAWKGQLRQSKATTNTGNDTFLSATIFYHCIEKIKTTNKQTNKKGNVSRKKEYWRVVRHQSAQERHYHTRR